MDKLQKQIAMLNQQIKINRIRVNDILKKHYSETVIDNVSVTVYELKG
jgi:beta-xylosidase